MLQLASAPCGAIRSCTDPESSVSATRSVAPCSGGAGARGIVSRKYCHCPVATTACVGAPAESARGSSGESRAVTANVAPPVPACAQTATRYEPRTRACSATYAPGTTASTWPKLGSTTPSHQPTASGSEPWWPGSALGRRCGVAIGWKTTYMVGCPVKAVSDTESGASLFCVRSWGGRALKWAHSPAATLESDGAPSCSSTGVPPAPMPVADAVSVTRAPSAPPSTATWYVHPAQKRASPLDEPLDDDDSPDSPDDASPEPSASRPSADAPHVCSSAAAPGRGACDGAVPPSAVA